MASTSALASVGMTPAEIEAGVADFTTPDKGFPFETVRSLKVVDVEGRESPLEALFPSPSPSSSSSSSSSSSPASTPARRLLFFGRNLL